MRLHKAQARIRALRATAKTQPRRYEIVASDGEATVYLYDVIGGWDGILAKQFVKDFAALKAPTIHLRINSPGGDVFEGRAIATAIRQHPSNVVAHIDGLAASAASYIAIAADTVEIAQGAMLMIHRAWGFAMGNAADMTEMAAILEKIDGTLVEDYVAATGNTAEQIRAWLDAETWFTAEEAVANGFADRIAEDAQKAQASWNLSVFDDPPEDEERDEPIAAAAADPAPEPEDDPDFADAARRFAVLESLA